MQHRNLAATGRLMLAVVAVALSAASAAGQTPRAADAKAKGGSAPPRTAWGDPNIQGVWNFATLTPMERPDELAGKDVLSDQEAAEFAAKAAQRSNRDFNVPEGQVGDYNNFWYDRGNNVIETKRSSLITDPSDGKTPPLTPEVQKQVAMLAEKRKGVGGDEPTRGGFVEDLGSGGLRVRCILGFNSGPPMTPSAYNNNVQIVQAPGHVVIANEMNHNTRIVPLDGRPYGAMRRWVGESRGRWDGSTLVVETKNFLRETNFRNSGANLHLIERFTRVDDDTLRYEAMLQDPTTWTRSWAYEVPMTKSDPQYIYEYACHEGNVGLVNILAGARAMEAAAAAKR
jgi:hypothetical protein